MRLRITPELPAIIHRTPGSAGYVLVTTAPAPHDRMRRNAAIDEHRASEHPGSCADGHVTHLPRLRTVSCRERVCVTLRPTASNSRPCFYIDGAGYVKTCRLIICAFGPSRTDRAPSAPIKTAPKKWFASFIDAFEPISNLRIYRTMLKCPIREPGPSTTLCASMYENPTYASLATCQPSNRRNIMRLSGAGMTTATSRISLWALDTRIPTIPVLELSSATTRRPSLTTRGTLSQDFAERE